MDDTTLTLRQIQKSPARLRQHMIDISKFGTPRSQIREPVDSTRFLIIDTLIRKDTMPSTSGSGLKQAHISASSPTLLQVARRSALKSPSAYAAVSYCWKRDPREGFKGGDKPIDVLYEDSSIK